MWTTKPATSMVSIGNNRDGGAGTGAGGNESEVQPGTAVFALPGGGALVFESPLEVLAATAVGEVLPLLRRVDAALRDGGWVAGMLAYEAAPAFDRALRTCARGPLSLGWVWFFPPRRRGAF